MRSMQQQLGNWGTISAFAGTVSAFTHNDASQSVELLWTSDELVAETSTWQHTTHTKQTSMPPVGFEPTVSTGERPQTHALERAGGTGIFKPYKNEIHVNNNFKKNTSYAKHSAFITYALGCSACWICSGQCASGTSFLTVHPFGTIPPLPHSCDQGHIILTTESVVK